MRREEKSRTLSTDLQATKEINKYPVHPPMVLDPAHPLLFDLSKCSPVASDIAGQHIARHMVV